MPLDGAGDGALHDPVAASLSCGTHCSKSTGPKLSVAPHHWSAQLMVSADHTCKAISLLSQLKRGLGLNTDATCALTSRASVLRAIAWSFSEAFLSCAAPALTRVCGSRQAGKVRIRQHANPLKRELQVPAGPLDWESVYADSGRPLVLDIGSAGGRFPLALSRTMTAHNFLGIDIRPAVHQPSAIIPACLPIWSLAHCGLLLFPSRWRQGIGLAWRGRAHRCFAGCATADPSLEGDPILGR
jgi:hypothetical protein